MERDSFSDDPVEIDGWRDTREFGWYNDVGYQFQDVLNRHIYESWKPGVKTKQDDPGWHPCRCGWEGYWAMYHNHVANHLRKALTDKNFYPVERYNG
jgi:hypothetical protein